MMKTLIKLAFVFVLTIFVTVFISNSGISQVTKDFSTGNTNFNNPKVTYGPALDNPLSNLAESFEGAIFPPAGWIKLNPDGGTGWNRQTAGTSPIPGWTGGIITTPPGGGTKVAFATWNTGGAISNNQWLVTPQLTNSTFNDSISFWVRFWPDNVYSDTVDVKISTTTPTVAGFTINVATLIFPKNSPDTNWTKYSYSIGNLIPTGSSFYVAFVERVLDNLDDGASVSLDLVSVFSTPICDPGTPHIEILDNPHDPLTHLEGCYVYQKEYPPYFPSDTEFVELHCGLNSIKAVDPCNPWVLTWYVAFFEDENDKVKVLKPTINWDTLICQDMIFDVIYPQNFDYTYSTYYDSVVMKITMIPHPVDNCVPNGIPYVCYNEDTIYNVNCWAPICLDERITLECIDSCEVPNSAICRMEWDKPLPVELNSFVSIVENENVILKWTTATEENNSGFDIERRTDGIWNKVGFVSGKGNSTVPADYTFTDKNLNSGIYGYRLKQIDYNGNFEYYNLDNNVSIGVPDKFSLSQNYPNPFNPATKIEFALPKDGNTTLKIFDMSGREMMTMFNEFRSAGYYTVELNASNLASGIYYYKLTAGDNTAVKKMVVIK